MIKLKDILINETASTRAMRDSEDGASKQFLKDFDKAFKKKSKELGYGKLSKTVKSYNVQVSKPAGFNKPITFDKRKGIEVDYQIGDFVRPGRELSTYKLKDFIKDMKRGFSGYKIEKTGVKTHFYLSKGGNTYHLSYTPTIATSHVIGSSRV
tara:strand:- start:30 stop:488 length:459 start_codon:yes stop_codon:yes gene_type:complete